MKTPTGFFWAWHDIGSGPKWHVCFLKQVGNDTMIVYCAENFEDYWYDDDWDQSELIEIPKPKPPE